MSELPFLSALGHRFCDFLAFRRLGGIDSKSDRALLFSQGQFVEKQKLSEWFNRESATFGGKSAIDTVKNLVGHASRFDLSNLAEVPNVDLPSRLGSSPKTQWSQATREDAG